MKSVYFIRTRDNRPYILVTVSAGSTDFQPLSEDADDVAQALDTAYQKRAITKNELDSALDDDLRIEGPLTIARGVREQIADFLEEAHVPRYQSGTKPPAMISKTIYSADIADTVLDDFPREMRPNIIEYKAMAFIADQTKTTFNYEVKRVRAMWDPTLSIPGTNRRGGWRCPVGTRYGGQITDRFGRNCGWGVARRIANAITNIGERMESVDDRRRGRRVARRNERMLGRLQRDAGGGGRIERGLRGVAERLEGGEGQGGGNRGGIFGDDGPLRIGPARMPRQPREQERQPRPQPKKPRNVVEEVDFPEQPVRPRRRRGEAVSPDATTTELGDAPRAGENYDDYVNRKFAEYEARIAEINRRGGRAGLLTRDEWYTFNRNNLREAWGRANGGEIPNEANVSPRPAREPQPRAPRRRRVNASDAQAADTANRRPRPEDAPIPQQRPTARPNRVRTVNREEEFKRQKRDAIRNIPADATAAERRDYKDYVNQFDPRPAGMQVPVLMQFEEWREFNNEVRRANGQRPLGPRRQRRAPDGRGFVTPGNGGEPNLGGSIPDARSERNVYNKFRENGLPDTAYWREPNANFDDVEKAELERRFGRYYGADNRRNDRGDYVNNMIKRRGQQGAPAGGRQAPPEPPARPAAPQAPAAPPEPPAAPARPQGRVRQQRGRKRNVANPNDGAAAKAVNPYPPRTNKHGSLGIDRKNGLLGDYVANDNPNITTQDQATAFVRNGGDLSEVPHRFWHDAVKDNSSSDPVDRTKRFRQLRKNGGAIGETELFVLRDADGKPTKQGWVFKAASSRDNAGELIGWNFQAALGIQNDGAVIDGKTSRGADFVILPFAQNGIPENAVVIPAAGNDNGLNYHKEAMDKDPTTLAGRIATLGVNFLLGVADRHGQNGFAQMFAVPGQGKVGVHVAWDLGWVMRQPDASIESYARGYSMDAGVVGKLRATVSGTPGGLRADIATRRKIQQDTVATLRDMVAKTNETLSVGRQRFIEQSLKNMQNPSDSEKRIAGAVFDRLTDKIGQLETLAQEIEGIQVR